MIKTRQRGKFTEIYTTEGYIHKKGSDDYSASRRMILLPSDSVDNYEEIMEIPPYTKAEYDEMVAKLVREKYSESEEFAIQRKAINAAFSPSPTSVDSIAFEEYQAYNNYVNDCKKKAKNPELYKTHNEE